MKNTMVVALVLIAGAAGYFVIHSHSASVAVSREGEQEVFLKHGAEIDAEDFLAAAREGRRKKQQPASSTPTTSTPAPDPSSFSDSFSTTATIVETNSASLSSSQRWWVNSGAYLYTGNANAKTVSGALPASDSWFKEYAATNPEDTDGGVHPQNIFRLVQKGLWQNFSQEVYYTISAINQSASTNRNASNGLFLFNRYQNGDNLYYVGLRVDGNAVIKKKYNGTYYTMASTKVFPGTYNRDTSANLLPLNTPIGIRSVVTNTTAGVTIKMYTDVGNTGVWKLTLETTDAPGMYGSAVIDTEGFAGIRTDFLDAAFTNYKITAI
jgi:hypothetical protein